MTRLAESELVLNPDGSIYHLRLHPDQIASDIILVGDPQRVEVVSGYFDHVEFKIQNREIITHTGTFRNRRITVMSTGMGTDNIDIVLNELDALVNIDLNSRTIKNTLTSLNLVRLGTSGALQPDIPLNAFVMSEYGLGLDGLMHFYHTDNPMFDHEINEAFRQYAQWPANLPSTYVVRGSDYLRAKLGEGMLKGITATAPGFYGPQGRCLRLTPGMEDINDRLEAFRYHRTSICNFEMETSALYGLSALLGHHAATICVAIANRPLKAYSKDYKTYMNQLIQLVLERLTE